MSWIMFHIEAAIWAANERAKRDLERARRTK